MKMIKFGELRTCISQIDRVSICMQETLGYENYRFIGRVPEEYNEYLVYGVGMIESEFPIEEAIEPEVRGNRINDKEFLAPCMEIRLTKGQAFLSLAGERKDSVGKGEETNDKRSE